MSASRASANARLVQKHQRRSASSGAKASANKFTEKQSHFERRREEDQVRMMQQASGNQSLFDGSSSGRTASDALLGTRREAWRGSGGGVQAGSEDAPSPFAMQQQRKRSGHVPIGAGSTAMSTVGGSTFGMPTAHATRSQRRTARFNLSDKTSHGALATEEGNGLLGASVGSQNTDAPWHAIENRDAAGDDQPGQKRTREERFHDVVSSSKMHRAQQQRERADREDETKALDKEIDGLLHLLTPRDKIKEEHDAFLRSGTPHVRHLLKTIKKKDGYEARQLRLRGDGEFTVTSLAGTAAATAAGSGAEAAAQGHGSRRQKADASQYAAPAKPADVADVLDDAGRRLLAKIRKGQKAAEERAAAEEDAANEESEDGIPARVEDDDDVDDVVATRADEDEFDKMLNLMSLDPRRARATDRTLDEEEEAERAAQQALLEADRGAIPSLGLAEQDQHMLTRAEWMEQGGDRAFHMDGGEGEDVYGDNVDIPSSYEGDSENDEDRDAAAGGSEDQDEAVAVGGDEKAAASSSTAATAALDRLMAELETIARSSVPAGGQTGSSSEAEAATTREAHRQRRQHLHKIITQLHSYAGQHVLQVAELFRLVLIEAERSFLRHKRGTLSRSLLLHLYVITKLFPMSDYRHEVTTPFLLFLCSTLLQSRLETLRDVHSYLVLAGLLLTSMRSGGGGSGRFCAEVIVAPLNVLLLQLPKSIVEPAKYQGLKVPIPLVDRCDAPLLTTTQASTTSSSSPSEPHRVSVDLLQEDHFEPENLLLAAYRLLNDVVDLYSTVPALPAAILEPFNFFQRLLNEHDGETNAASSWQWRPSPAVRAAHDALAQKLSAASLRVEDHRTPLAMRYFRPRPLRLFEPLLAEQEANAVKTEIRSMKREIREDKKRVMRHLTAEATVQRRAHEKESAMEDAQREKRYNQVLGQLQAQQHTMKTVDAMMSKARGKPKKGISGAPTAPGGGGDGGDD